MKLFALFLALLFAVVQVRWADITQGEGDGCVDCG